MVGNFVLELSTLYPLSILQYETLSSVRFTRDLLKIPKTTTDKCKSVDVNVRRTTAVSVLVDIIEALRFTRLRSSLIGPDGQVDRLGGRSPGSVFETGPGARTV